MERIHLTGILLFASAIWGLYLIMSGVAIDLGYFKPFSTVVGLTLLAITAFNFFLWKFSLFQGWLVKQPVLIGTWRGKITSNWISPETGEGVAPIDALLVIRQNYGFISVRLFTKESQSHSLSSALLKAEDGVFELVANYRNTPRYLVRKRSEIHNGSFSLNVETEGGLLLSGHYWTDRNTAGELSFHHENRKLASSYSPAVDA